MKRLGVALILVILTAGAAALWWLARGDAPRPEPTPEELQLKGRKLFEIAAILDPAAKAAELKAYVDENPQGPYLDMAYGLLLPAVAAGDPKEAVDLADGILKRHDGPDDAALRFRAYQFKLGALTQGRDPAGAALLAREILEKENDPELLRLASRFDPSRADAFNRKIAAVEDIARKKQLAERSAKLLDLSPGEWEAKNDADRLAHLDRLIAALEAADPAADERLPTLRRLRISLLIQTGQAKPALLAIGQVPEAERGVWFHSAKASALEMTGDREAALDAHFTAFATRPNRESWTRIRALSEEKGLSAADSAARLRAAMAAGAKVFPSFQLRTPDGRPLGLDDLRNEAILVNFFFPG